MSMRNDGSGSLFWCIIRAESIFVKLHATVPDPVPVAVTVPVAVPDPDPDPDAQDAIC